MNKKIAVLPGDGIGPEVVAQGIKILEAVCDKYNFKCELAYGDIGTAAIKKHGIPLPKETIDICKNADAIFFGAVGDDQINSDPAIKIRAEQGLLDLRKALGLFYSVRPIKTYRSKLGLSPLKKEILEGVDMLIFRELSSGIYYGEKGYNMKEEAAFDVCRYTKDEIVKVSKKAFKSARKRRKKITVVDKANVMETSRLWRSTVRELAKNYPDVKVEFLYIDNVAMKMIQNPSEFDVILCSNLFGDILSDIGSVISGSIGLLPSASFGGKKALFEPVHGPQCHTSGKDIANPLASILSVAMMFDYFKMQDQSNDIYAAVHRCINESIMTQDLKPRIITSCSELGDIVYSLITDDLVDLNTEKMSTSKSVII